MTFINMRRLGRIPSLTGGILLTGASMSAFADVMLEEVVVTARKRAESLQDVPMAISAFTSEDIERAGVDRPEDYIALTPSVSMSNTISAGDTQIMIRGLLNSRDAEANFAYVVDGVLKTNPNLFNEELLDVKQIEVLKGPQGALYGRNAVAGAIIVTTTEPTDEVAGKIKVGLANDNTHKVSFALSGPLVEEKLLGRMSASFSTTDGQYKNDFLNRDDIVDNYEDLTLRGRLLWNASDRLAVDLNVTYSEIDSGTINFNAVPAQPALTFIDPGFFADINDHEFKFINNVPPRNEQQTSEVSIKVDYNLDAGDLTVVASYSDLEEFLLADGAGAFFGTDLCNAQLAATDPSAFTSPFDNPTSFAFGILPPYTPTVCDGYQFQRVNQEDSSIEVRFSSDADQSIRWVAGLYYADIEREFANSTGLDSGQGFVAKPFVPLTGPNPTELLFWDISDVEVFSVFGDISFDITNNIELSLSARYDVEDRKMTSLVPVGAQRASGVLVAGAPALPINPGQANIGDPIAARDETFEQLQPKVSLRWSATDAVSLYGSWGIGFRSGGFNPIGTRALVLQNFNNPLGINLTIGDEYDKEVAESWELGFKSEWFDRKLLVNGALYSTDVEDAQFFEFLTGPFGFIRTLSTIDETSVEGLEVDFKWLLHDNWSLYGGVGIMESEIQKNLNRPYTKGNDLPHVPEYTLNLGGQFIKSLESGVDFIVRLDFERKGETWYHTVQEDLVPTIFATTADFSQTRREEVDLLNLRVSLVAENWSLTAWSRNLTDEEYLAEGSAAPEFGGIFTHPSKERTIGIDFSYEF